EARLEVPASLPEVRKVACPACGRNFRKAEAAPAAPSSVPRATTSDDAFEDESPPRRGGGRMLVNVVVAVLALLIIGGAGTAAVMWWMDREAERTASKANPDLPGGVGKE